MYLPSLVHGNIGSRQGRDEWEGAAVDSMLSIKLHQQAVNVRQGHAP